METPVIISIVSSSAIVISAVFAGIQLRYVQKQRARDAEMLLVRSFQTPDFMKAMSFVMGMPDNLSKKEILDLAGHEKGLVLLWLGTWEGLGVMVYRHEISLSTLDDYFSGPIIISWKKLQRYVEDDRKDLQRDTMHEWFQWLAERMFERESKSPARPAHIDKKDWKERPRII
ncbi:MAG TPA: hypothetical protein VD905_13805 [Flavobacteriales bacterium]|nr:hypothetical protein [Flavobacteriales bacterium]